MLYRITDTANLLPLDTVEASTPDEAVTLSAYGPDGVDAVAVDAPRIPMTLAGEGGPFYALTNVPGVWNGWDAPVLPFDEAVAVMEYVNADNPDWEVVWDEDRHAFTELDSQSGEGDTPAGGEGYTRVSTPYGHGYALGAYGWIWTEATPDADTL